MADLIPVSRRLIFRGLIGLGAAVAAPAIVRAGRLPPEWEEWAAMLDGMAPEGGRAAAIRAANAGFHPDDIHMILLRRPGRPRNGRWPVLQFWDAGASVDPTGIEWHDLGRA